RCGVELKSVEALEELFAGRPTKIGFRRRNDSIPGDLRISWRLAVLCLLLARFRAKTARIEHLHTLWWAIRSEATRDLIIRWFNNKPVPDEIIVRFDPSLTKTIDLAVGQGLVESDSNGVVKLTSTGLAMAQAVGVSDDVLADEKGFLESLPRSISQRAMREMTEWR
uniref:hypothetical protein n=1 Tax=Streptomyces sp. DSM 41540 TaxID=3448657 RepID=UPI004040078B